MNPILPDNCFVPDAEARLMPDGRMYLYGSWDIPGCDEYCSRELHCFSSDDLKSWTDHGCIFRNDEEHTGVHTIYLFTDGHMEIQSFYFE